MGKYDQLEDRRDRRSGKFTAGIKRESETVLVALDREQNPIDAQAPSTRRPITHAVIRDAETPRAVKLRSTKSIERDTELLGLLERAVKEKPSVMRAGRSSDRKIAVLPPRGLEKFIQPVYAAPESSESAIAEYQRQLKSEASAAKNRITAAELTLKALDDGDYELQPTQVLRWVGSFQAARQHITSMLGPDTGNLERLYIGNVMRTEAS